MHTTTKGAVAAGAAAVLLLGGAGTLAYWSDSASVNGGSVTSGSLSLDATGCDAAWVYASGASEDDPIVQGIVPGDSIKKTCTFTVGAVGDHLEASPDVPDSVTYAFTGNTGATLDLDVDATYELDGLAFAPTDTITEDDDTAELAAEIVVTFPFGTTTVNANDTQGLTATLDALTVTLTQDLGLDNPNT